MEREAPECLPSKYSALPAVAFPALETCLPQANAITILKTACVLRRAFRMLISWPLEVHARERGWGYPRQQREGYMCRKLEKSFWIRHHRSDHFGVDLALGAGRLGPQRCLMSKTSRCDGKQEYLTTRGAASKRRLKPRQKRGWNGLCPRRRLHNRHNSSAGAHPLIPRCRCDPLGDQRCKGIRRAVSDLRQRRGQYHRRRPWHH